MLVEPGAPRILSLGHDLRTDIRLLEVDEDVLQELQAEGLCFKGSSTESAVLCTSTKTYAVKNVETTNLVMLVDGTDYPSAPSQRSPLTSHLGNASPGYTTGFATQEAKNVEASSREPINVACTIVSHWEIVPTAALLHRLDEILADKPYGSDEANDEEEEESAARDPMDLDTSHTTTSFGVLGKTWEDLLAEVQASPLELRAALKDRGAVLLDGKWRGVDSEYLGTLLELILCSMVSQGWKDHQVPVQEAIESLKEDKYRPELIVHCLQRFGSPVHMEEEEAGEGEERNGDVSSEMYCLDSKAVCLYYGRQLLEKQEVWLSVEEFMEEWTKLIPLETMVPDLEMLRGHVLRLEGGAGIKAFSAAALPQDPAERFKVLFAERARWLLSDLEPFIEGLTGQGVTVEGLVFKYARANQQRPTDDVTYTAR